MATIAWWGPRGPEAGNWPGAPTFSHPDATIRCGMILGRLWTFGFKPTDPKEPDEVGATKIGATK